ncbi:hypothetical protein BGZ98_006992 [Dissophora globulifera]|nr:hypothetical protein BGZ98_006992 [Dissophora globulifera]
MPATPTARPAELDSDNDFASASDGEEYESMDTPAARPDVTPSSRGAHRASPPTSRRSDKPTTAAAPTLPTPTLPTPQSTTAFRSVDPRTSSQGTLPQRSVIPLADEKPLAHHPSNFSRGLAANSFQSDNQQESDAYQNALLSRDRDWEEGARRRDPAFSGDMASKEQASGWGSFSSWINTAVSTVSEVIENPNVVVSKAHTIGQGIRNVATEHIDRVYESLDPEYEYERERQQQKHRQPSTHIGSQRAQSVQPTPSFTRPSGKPSAELFRSHSQQADQSTDKGDLSDLLESARSERPSPAVSQAKIGLQPTSPPSVTLSPPLLSTKKLGMKDDLAVQDDDWGEDAWGDDWAEKVSDLPTPESTHPHPPASKQELAMDPAITNSHGSQRNMASFNDKPASPPSTQPRIQHSPIVQTKTIHQTMDSSRNVRDLFDTQGPEKSDSTGSTPNRGLFVPTSQQGGGKLDQPPQRRPSAEIRPAEALFSTLDFASNALGSAVLGVHRKVTQASQGNSMKSAAGGNQDSSRPISPSWSQDSRRSSRDGAGQREMTDKGDRMAVSNPSLEAVGGNVVSTGLGALEILGKKAVDVISDVIPAKMNLATIFDASAGRGHLGQLQSIASTVRSRVLTMNSNRPELREMGQMDELEMQLSPTSLDSAIKELSVDLLAGHKDFRSMVSLLEQMGVQGTSQLRQLRNCTRKLTTLVPDSVNAFEQEWHNHQSRASERDFFARVPIKRFFESRLLSTYFDSLRALSQFTERTCEQALRLAEDFNIRLAEKSIGGGDRSTTAAAAAGGEYHERPPPLILAPILRQFLGSLIAEIKFMTTTYSLTLDALLETAKGFTTPLDRQDWGDLSMGVDKIKVILSVTETRDAIDLIHSGALGLVEMLKDELVLDALHGRLAPKPRAPRPKQATVASPPPSARRMGAPLESTKTASPVLAAKQPLRSGSTEQHSALSSSETLSPLSSRLPPPPSSPMSGGQTRPGMIAVRPTTPLGGSMTSLGMAPVSKESAAGSNGRRLSSTSSQGSTRSGRAPAAAAPPAKPTLKDEDFFSILND